MIDVLLPIAAILALVIVNGVFVAAEFALVGARRSRVDILAQNGNRAAQWLLRIFDREAGKDSYIAIAQLGITLASIGLGMYGEPAVARWLYGPLENLGLSYDQSHAVGFVIALSAITFLHVVFGEMIPKAMALQAPEKVSISLNPVMRLFAVLFRPMVMLLNRIAFGLMRLLGIPDPGKGAMLYSYQELEIATEDMMSTGQMNGAQARLIENIFEMEDRSAQELMTSRARMVAIPVTAGADEIAAIISEHTLARYPVFDGSLDDVIGVLHVKDFIRARVTQGPIDLRTLARPAPRVAAGMSAYDLMALFKKQRVHGALVVDEFGGALGFVTMDDLVADLIDEESDAGSEWITVLPDGAMLLDGEVTLAELEEDHDLNVAHPEVSTVAGLFLAKTGVLPKRGDVLNLKGVRFIAEDVQGLKILRVRLERPPTRR
ncbi:MAG: CBS domain containing-hemolysin-like protein [Brevundimonas sp.]|jgi:CBS domain containing-hemolysin-like protein|uniref:hemolysin family protein n=1 Tax=Brevundimonas sp. TaxID=1871086 RepID=UPI0039E61A7F